MWTSAELTAEVARELTLEVLTEATQTKHNKFKLKLQK